MTPFKNILRIIFKYKMLAFASFVLYPTQSFTQNTVIEELKNKFEQYHTNYLQEKVFVHTDKTLYLAGEAIWFKAYVLDGFFNKPLSLSQVIYVEIIDKDSKPVLQTKIAVETAMGNGSIAIPVSIASGSYTFRAYTQWMKNFSADFFYEQAITIINTVRNVPLPSDSSSKKIDFNFFPEGGNLVAGLASKIAFKATYKNGNGLNCKGVILNDKNDTVASFKSLMFGMGNLIFTPLKNEHYKAVIKLDNNTIIYQNLSNIYNSGFVMKLTEKNDQVIVSINCTDDIKNAPIYLFVHSHHLIKSIQAASPINSKIIFNVDKKDLADGISHFTIFNSDKKPVCERLYFKQSTSRLLINTTTEKETYLPRENVKVQINTTDELKVANAADLSMSVFLIDSLQPKTYTDIESYLWLSSDLKGKIESPEYYFNHNNLLANDAVDNLMLTQGWRRFNWDNILQDKTPFFEFTPEYEGLNITGRIVDKTSGKPIKNAFANLSVPNKRFQFFNAITNVDGKFNYSFRDLYGANEIITQTDSLQNNYQIDIDNPFSNLFSDRFKTTFNLPINTKESLLQRHIGMQVQHTYNIEENRRFVKLNELDTTAFYGLPTYSFNLDAFTRFNTMEEVIKEFVTDVQLRTKDNEPYFRVYNRSTQSLFDNDPLLLIDGVPIFDPNKIVSFNPLKIKTIDVVSNKYYLGAATYSGIISFKTYDGDLGGYQLDPNAVVLKFDGLQRQREFYNPAYETGTQQQSRIPDFRTTLSWKPDLKTDNIGKTLVNFYTSDVKGKFAIVVQGITKDGKSGSSISTFEVKP